MPETIYEDGTYLRLHPDWHAEDGVWKAEQVLRLLDRQGLRLRSALEVGCGTGTVLAAVHKRFALSRCIGYDIAATALERAKALHPEVQYVCGDAFADNETYDLLLAIDVIEHVADLAGFLRACQAKATYKLYHIPLDICLLNVVRNRLLEARERRGHLHYFMPDTALAWLRDTGHSIIEATYTAGEVELEAVHPATWRLTVANVLRRAIGALSVAHAARILGGYSLLVLAS